MKEHFSSGWANCLDESMMVWLNEYAPGFMYVPRKPHPFGNEWHSICCCASGIMFAVELVEGKDAPRELGPKRFEELGKTVGLLLRLTESLWGTAKTVILDSGFCVLKGIVELKKKGVYASALIKKRKYWPKHIRGDDIKKHFEDKEIGAADAWQGEMEGVPFHVFGMKDTDYVMSLMSTYGTLNDTNCRESARDYKEGQEKWRKVFRYTEVIDNHYKFRHSVDDHNGLRHFPISFKESWATKLWPTRVFAFLLAITEVNVKLAAAHFYGETFASMIKF